MTDTNVIVWTEQQVSTMAYLSETWIYQAIKPSVNPYDNKANTPAGPIIMPGGTSTGYIYTGISMNLAGYQAALLISPDGNPVILSEGTHDYVFDIPTDALLPSGNAQVPLMSLFYTNQVLPYIQSHPSSFNLDPELVWLGHSLAGNTSAIGATLYGGQAVTFNTAGTNGFVANLVNLLGYTMPQIDNYIDVSLDLISRDAA